MDDEDKLERMYDQRLKQAMEEGIGQSINELQCADYTKEQIDEDDHATEKYEDAIEEIQNHEEEEANQKILEQQKQFDAEKKKLAEHYEKMFAEIQLTEKAKAEQMKT